MTKKRITRALSAALMVAGSTTALAREIAPVEDKTIFYYCMEDFRWNTK